MKLFWKIFATVFISFVVIIVATSYITLDRDLYYIKDSIIEENGILAEFTAREMEIGYLESKWPFETLRKLSERSDFLFWWVVMDDGTIHLADNTSFVGTGAYDYFPGMGEMPGEGGEKLFEDPGQRYGIFIKSMKIGTSRWTFWIGFSMREMQEAMRIIVITIILISVLSMAALSIFLYLTVKYFLKPLNKLREGALMIGKGEAGKEIKIKAGDEMGDLAKTFNEMSRELKKSRDDLERYNKGLEKDVRERTRELEKKMDDINKAKAATLNIMEDISEANEELETKQKEIEKANRELKKFDRLKSEFMNMGAHELKTPLIPIVGYLDMMKDSRNLKPDQKDQIDICLRNARRLQMMVNDILDTSKLEAGSMKFDMKPMNPTVLIKNTVKDMAKDAAAKGLKLADEIPEKLPNIMGDEYRLTQVMANLVNNAIKYTDKGTITVYAQRKGNSIEVYVQDTGIGIAKNDMPKIFTKFFQVDTSEKRKHGGTGLGLAICKGIIKHHGGNIWVESNLGKGSRFIFTLPIKK
jgi:signal transduction histidine kinase